MSDSSSSIPVGLCQCGCGGKTTVSDKTRPAYGHIKGEPVPFCPGHNMRVKQPPTLEEYKDWWRLNTNVAFGTCWCGCGEATPISPRNDFGRFIFIGYPKKYVSRHQRRRKDAPYVVDLETGCWIWQHVFNRTGYGRIWNNDRKRHDMAHRVYYQRANGEIPEGLGLDHLCRNRACVNPDHLEPVTGVENTRRGAGTKLTLEAAREIKTIERRDYAAHREAAKHYGVSVTTIRDILRGRIWKDA